MLYEVSSDEAKGINVSHVQLFFCGPDTGLFHNNINVSFEKEPAPGFYDSSEEQARATSTPIGHSLWQLEHKCSADDCSADDETELRQRQRHNEKESQDPHDIKPSSFLHVTPIFRSLKEASPRSTTLGERGN